MKLKFKNKNIIKLFVLTTLVFTSLVFVNLKKIGVNHTNNFGLNHFIDKFAKDGKLSYKKFNFNKVLKPLKRLSIEQMKRYSQLDEGDKPILYTLNIPNNIMTLDEFISMEGVLFGERVEVYRTYAKKIKNHNRFVYEGAISKVNNLGEKTSLGKINLLVNVYDMRRRAFSVSGEMNFKGENYNISSVYGKNIVSLAKTIGQDSAIDCGTDEKSGISKIEDSPDLNTDGIQKYDININDNRFMK